MIGERREHPRPTIHIEVVAGHGDVTISDVSVNVSGHLEAYQEIESKRHANDRWSMLSSSIIDRMARIDHTYDEINRKIEGILRFISEDIVRGYVSLDDNSVSRLVLESKDIVNILNKKLSAEKMVGDKQAASRTALHLAQFYECLHEEDLALKHFYMAIHLDSDSLSCRCIAGNAMLSLGLASEALEIFEDAVSIRGDHIDDDVEINLYMGYGAALFFNDRYEQSREIYAWLAMRCEEGCADNDMHAHTVFNNFGWSLFECGYPEQGLPYILQSLSLKKERSETGASIATTLCNCAVIWRHVDDTPRAFRALDEAEQRIRSEYGRIYPNHPLLARIANERGVLRLSERQFIPASQEFALATKIMEHHFGNYDERTIKSMHNNYLSLLHGGSYKAARVIADEVFERLKVAAVSEQTRVQCLRDYEYIFGSSFLIRSVRKLRMWTKIRFWR